MELTDYLVFQFDDTVARHRAQVLDLVPRDRQKDRLPGGNSIAWATYHVGRHAALALDVLGRRSATVALSPPGEGLQEVEQDWLADVSPEEADSYATAVFAEVRAYLSTGPDLGSRPDVAAGLRASGIDENVFGWLYRMWDQPVAFLVAWPLTGHISNHVGEMIATRNQMGLSPFR
ncbi:MAG: hypothetical protein JWN80_2611 [Microbacteriaceae bacterium]|jgi:hypothetical protein|nr:hypothetical protein [Microbacteriaceae bacterium]